MKNAYHDKGPYGLLGVHRIKTSLQGHNGCNFDTTLPACRPKKRECRAQCQVCASAAGGAPILDVMQHSAPLDEGDEEEGGKGAKWTTIEVRTALLVWLAPTRL
jgi:hypothetical protein